MQAPWGLLPTHAADSKQTRFRVACRCTIKPLLSLCPAFFSLGCMQGFSSQKQTNLFVHPFNDNAITRILFLLWYTALALLCQSTRRCSGEPQAPKRQQTEINELFSFVFSFEVIQFSFFLSGVQCLARVVETQRKQNLQQGSFPFVCSKTPSASKSRRSRKKESKALEEEADACSLISV